MTYFTMSTFRSKEDLYKAKAEYLESALKQIVDAHQLDDSVWKEDDLWCTDQSEGEYPLVWGELK
jgi:hypothetical protein